MLTSFLGSCYVTVYLSVTFTKCKFECSFACSGIIMISCLHGASSVCYGYQVAEVQCLCVWVEVLMPCKGGSACALKLVLLESMHGTQCTGGCMPSGEGVLWAEQDIHPSVHLVPLVPLVPPALHGLGHRWTACTRGSNGLLDPVAHVLLGVCLRQGWLVGCWD
eukprot:jgi/Botrbrau1/11013/Bobra.101_1s0011.1